MPTLNGLTCDLYFEDTGGPLPPIVFLHGWCDGSESWTETIAALRGSFRCLAPDMRGLFASFGHPDAILVMVGTGKKWGLAVQLIAQNDKLAKSWIMRFGSHGLILEDQFFNEILEFVVFLLQ